MTDKTMIASAIALPEADPPAELSPSISGRKRRQSENSSEEQEESKRQRISSPGKNSPRAAAAAATATRDKDEAYNDHRHDTKDAGPGPTTAPADSSTRDARRKSNITDEKQRSKRLFGALLGSLNQPGDRTSKRRQEIESRRKAELQRQDDQRVEDKHRRREKVVEMRKREQAVVDERNMRVRHSNMLDAANFLQTSSEPRLYYRPWDLRPDEEDRINDQIKEARAQIDKELEELHQPYQQDSKSEDRTSNGHESIPPNGNNDTQRDENAGSSNGPGVKAEKEDQAPAKSANHPEDSKPAEVPDSDTTNVSTNNITSGAEEHRGVMVQEERTEAAEEEGDHVVEADEDTVIY